MATQEQIQSVRFPDFISQRQQQLLNTLFGTTDAPGGVIGRPTIPPAQQVAGFTAPQLQAFQQAQQGIGSFLPFLGDATAAAGQGLQTAGMATQALKGLDFSPQGTKQFMDQYQKDVTAEALKEIDRQQQLAENRLAGQAVQAGAFGGSRFGVAQSELARNAQDLKSRRIFEDLSRNFQQSQAAARAANQQRLQAGQVFGQLGRGISGIGGAMAGLGAQGQALQGRDVSQLLGIGGLQQQQAQRELDIGTANLAALENAPFQQLSAGAGILQQLPGIGGGQQVVAPLAQTNPFAQAAGLIATGAGGLGALIG